MGPGSVDKSVTAIPKKDQGLAREQGVVRFSRLTQPRAHEYVAEQIRRQIMLQLVPVGHSLPSEREIANMFGVGRATVQKALEVLEGEHLVERRVGRTGGTFVTGLGAAGASKGLVLSRIRRHRQIIDEALIFRLTLEPSAAARAADMATSADLDKLRAAHESGTNAATDEDALSCDTELHLAIARSTHNRFFVDSIEQIRLKLNDALRALPESHLWRSRSNSEHQKVLMALEAGDASRARRAMLVHIKNTDRSVRALISAM
jgi:GntR family transcriptional repressor for pyruvate dehydrogenase complex